MNISNFYRFRLKAIHSKTKTEVAFPTVHVLVEKMNDGYLATCLEYLQSYQAPLELESIQGVIDAIYDYFFMTLKHATSDTIYSALENRATDELWTAVRKYEAKKYEDDLRFVENILKDELVDPALKEKIDERNKAEKKSEFVSKTEHDKVVEEQRKIIHQQGRIITDLLESYKNLKAQQMGLEGAEEEWQKAIEEASSVR